MENNEGNVQGNKNRGIIERRQQFLCLVVAVKLGYVSPEGIPYVKTREAVLRRLCSNHLERIHWGATENKFYIPKGNSLIKKEVTV